MPYLSDSVDAVSGHDTLTLACHSAPRCAVTQEPSRGAAVFPRKYRWPYQLPTFSGGPLHQPANRHSAI